MGRENEIGFQKQQLLPGTATDFTCDLQLLSLYHVNLSVEKVR